MAASTPQNYKVPSTSKISVDKLLRVGHYELEKTIGKGNFAVVKLASNIITKSKVAIKIIDKTCLNQEYLDKTFREISILKKLRHAHITRLYEVMESQTMIYLVTEYAPNGEIFDHLVERGRMKEPEAARVFTQLVSAVKYCHARGVVHRDLKAENVLLDKDMNIKLADFGFSNYYSEGSTLTTWCGSPPYAAPEVFQGLKYDGPKSDIWSLGVVLYAMVCGALPFNGKTLLELKSCVVTGKFRIPYFMSQDCEHLIRNMLVVEPDRRYTLKQIIKHRWLSEWAGELDDFNCSPTYSTHSANTLMRSGSSSSCNSSAIETSTLELDPVVTKHMLQLPGLTADMIAQSVQHDRFDKIYAIYYLLYDKLQQKRREHQRLQHHANLAYSRLRKTSITTGVVDRSEPVRQESVDRLSPLSNANLTQGDLGFQWPDVSMDLEKYGDLELECLARSNEAQTQNQTHLCANAGGNGVNTRRHTVGPGDVAHEQALANPNVPPINFKCSNENNDALGPHLPMNLHMLQNQPLHNLTIKDQHLLKPPMVMGASSFGRRASDGGANLHIYYPSSLNNMQQPNTQPQQMDAAAYYMNPSGIAQSGQTDMSLVEQPLGALGSDITSEENNEEIQRYMEIRGCAKRHTVGCTEDLSITHQQGETCPACGIYEPPAMTHLPTAMGHQTSTAAGVAGASGGGMRTRRSGLLTVTERPPVISPDLIREVEARMNRDYLPRALKLQQQQQQGKDTALSQSPPTGVGTAFGPFSNAQNCVGILQASSLAAPSNLVPQAATSSGAANSKRVHLKASKLPTVQEVGRFSPVRRASEGSKAQFQGPLQECQYLQKVSAQRNFLAPSPSHLENSISLPGSPIHGKPAPHLLFRGGQDIEVPLEIIKTLLPALERLVKEQRLNIDLANKIVNTGIVPLDLASYLGLTAHSGNALSGGGAAGGGAGGGYFDMPHMQQQQIYSYSVSPLSLSNNAAQSAGSGVINATSGPLMAGQTSNAMGTLSKQILGQASTYAPHMHPPRQHPNNGLVGQFSNINLSTGPATATAQHYSGSNSSSGCQSPVYNSFSGSSSPNPYMPGTGPFNPCAATAGGGGSSPLHQITKGISVLSTGGGGSITRGTSAASEIASSTIVSNQPLDLSMDICNADNPGTSDATSSAFGQQTTHTPPNWITPQASYYDLKPLNLSPAQTVRIVPTPPASPNLCIIQEENANNHLCHTITTGTPHSGCTGGVTGDDLASPCQPSHPQICLTDVQGSEITLVALSSDNSHDSDCDSLEPHTPLISLQGLTITEPNNDMPSITRGTGRKASLENENNSMRRDSNDINICPTTVGATTHSANDASRRGSDKSLGFSDDSLSNDSNNLSPCQEPSASSGFKSDSHSEIGDHTEGHLTPDSICDSRRMSEEMCYEVPLPHECSNLDPTRILEMVKQTIDMTMPPKGAVLHKAVINEESATSGANCTEGRISNASNATSESSTTSMETCGSNGITPTGATNLSLEYSGGLQIELQVCEGRGRDNQSAGKGIKLRRISGDQFEYGKLCQQLIHKLTMQQVAG